VLVSLSYTSWKTFRDPSLPEPTILTVTVILDIAALYAQGDERIVIYYNDGQGEFRGGFKIAARFPGVYGSMYFDLHDFDRDGDMDILYVNGDNFDYSQILKPYHGIRIYENDGSDNFQRKVFLPDLRSGKSRQSLILIWMAMTT
jgi:hypothetical protein